MLCRSVLCRSVLFGAATLGSPAATGCGSADGDSAQCGSTQAFIQGVVTSPDGSAAAGAIVTAVDIDPGDLDEATGEAGTDGRYELNVEGNHTWQLSATVDGCTTQASTLEVIACAEYALDIALHPCVGD